MAYIAGDQRVRVLHHLLRHHDRLRTFRLLAPARGDSLVLCRLYYDVGYSPIYAPHQPELTVARVARNNDESQDHDSIRVCLGLFLCRQRGNDNYKHLCLDASLS